MAEKLGYSEDQIEWVETISANRETALQNDEVDMIFATYSINDERKELIDFAGPYFVAGQDLLVAADNTDIAGPEDLEGKNLCSVTGSTSAENIKNDYAEGVQLVERRATPSAPPPSPPAPSTPSPLTTSSSPVWPPPSRMPASSRSSARPSPRSATAWACPTAARTAARRSTPRSAR